MRELRGLADESPERVPVAGQSLAALNPLFIFALVAGSLLTCLLLLVAMTTLPVYLF